MPDSPRGMEEVASQKQRAIEVQAGRSRDRYPILFISHRHEDKGVVEALVNLLEAAFSFEPWQMRCTSIPRLSPPYAEDLNEQIRKEVTKAKLVLGVITPSLKGSSYVLFELGACWGAKRTPLPLLARGATPADIPDPIAGTLAVKLTEKEEINKLLRELPEKLDLVKSKNSDKLSSLIGNLIKRARHEAGYTPVEIRARRSKTIKAPLEAKKKHLKQLLNDEDYEARYLSTLCYHTGLTRSECRRALKSINAWKVRDDDDDELWKLDR